jgi:hypothetical protein
MANNRTESGRKFQWLTATACEPEEKVIPSTKFSFVSKPSVRAVKPKPPPKVYHQWTKEEVDKWCEEQFDLS